MKFATFSCAEAEGAVLAHTVRLADWVIKKGHVLTASDVAALQAAGVASVMAARLDEGDIAEDEAARRISVACCGAGLEVGPAFTGRSNLIATGPGLAVIARDTLIELNSIDEGLTVATVQPFEVVTRGQLIATVKIIPFSLSSAVVIAAEAMLRLSPVVAGVAPFTVRKAGLILTRVAGLKPSLIDKRTRAIRSRLETLGSSLAHHESVAHDTAAVSRAIAAQAKAGLNPILVFGASAIVDRGDVIPQALTDAGGTVVHVGMPVDPGNLLMVGRIGDADVIGVPSCATSPKLNGFDWVLERLLADLPVGRPEIVAMAPGGLLTEIPARPQPRNG